MANEKDKSEQARKPVKIEDLSESTNASGSEQVKGGMMPRAGFGPTTEEDADEIGE